MRDMKGEIQKIADEIADQRHGCDFYELSENSQIRVYDEAMDIWNDRMQDIADSMRKGEIPIARQSLYVHFDSVPIGLKTKRAERQIKKIFGQAIKGKREEGKKVGRGEGRMMNVGGRHEV